MVFRNHQCLTRDSKRWGEPSFARYKVVSKLAHLKKMDVVYSNILERIPRTVQGHASATEIIADYL
jgi:hypothetical protein